MTSGIRQTNSSGHGSLVLLAIILLFDFSGAIILGVGPLAVVGSTKTVDANGIVVILQSCNPTCSSNWKFGFQPYNFYMTPKGEVGVGLGTGGILIFTNGTMISAWCTGGNEIVIQRAGGYPLGLPLWNYTLQAPCENP